MYSAYKLNKQGDNIQPWHTPFLICNQTVALCPVLTVASWPAYRFLRRQVRWSGIPIFFRIFQFIVIHIVKGFGIVNKAEVDVFSGTLAFRWSNGCWQFDLCSSAFSESSLNIRKFTVHGLLKPGLENFEHYFTSVWDEYNCAVVWTFFGIAFLWDWNENWPFPVLWPLLSFPNLLAYWVQHFHSIIFQDLGLVNSAGQLKQFLFDFSALNLSPIECAQGYQLSVVVSDITHGKFKGCKKQRLQPFLWLLLKREESSPRGPETIFLPSPWPENNMCPFLSQSLWK